MTIFENAWNILKAEMNDKEHEKKIISCLKKRGGAASLDECAKECGVSKAECKKLINQMDNVKIHKYGDVVLMDGL
jgi:response regulator of citrate/malate metabolism